MRARDHHQMSGRAGRRGIDRVGYVYTAVPGDRISARTVREVLFGRIEPIRSQFSLAYATILSLYPRLGDRVPEACARSFAFAAASQRGRTRRFYDQRVHQVRQRLEMLRMTGAIEGGSLTERGEFARSIHGYELPVTELVFGGHLRSLSEDDLNVLFTALVHEPKRGQWNAKPRMGSLKMLRRIARGELGDVLGAEHELGIDEPSKEAEFAVAAAVWAWSRGAAFDELESYTSMAPGDLIRCFRMTIQLMRQTSGRLPPADPLRARLRRAIDRINRDEVDAERQLRMAVDET
jgi:superfamily II RNA helicase